jgi:hypothetical protein
MITATVTEVGMLCATPQASIDLNRPNASSKHPPRFEDAVMRMFQHTASGRTISSNTRRASTRAPDLPYMSMTAFATVALLATRPAFTARPWRHLPRERAPPPPSGTAEADLIAAASSSAPGRRPSPSVHP